MLAFIMPQEQTQVSAVQLELESELLDEPMVFSEVDQSARAAGQQ